MNADKTKAGSFVGGRSFFVNLAVHPVVSVVRGEVFLL
jgi:hypothetical protein